MVPSKSTGKRARARELCSKDSRVGRDWNRVSNARFPPGRSNQRANVPTKVLAAAAASARRASISTRRRSPARRQHFLLGKERRSIGSVACAIAGFVSNRIDVGDFEETHIRSRTRECERPTAIRSSGMGCNRAVDDRPARFHVPRAPKRDDSQKRRHNHGG